MSVFFYFCGNTFYMIVVFGSDGFLGNRMVAKLQASGNVQGFNRGGMDTEENSSFRDTAVFSFTEKDAFFRFLPEHYREVKWVVYCDKRIPNTTLSVFRREFVQKLWTVAATYALPLLYAFHQPMESPVSDFQPDTFVQWAGKQFRKPPFWYIFRVGEVYGQGEESFGERISRVNLFYRQIAETGEANLPNPEREEEGADATRDYLYVQDAVRVFYWFMLHRPADGVYDLGSGFARTDIAVVNAIFRALKLPPRIRYSDFSANMPDEMKSCFLPDLRNLRGVGYRKPFFSVEKGVKSSLRTFKKTEKF